MTDLFTSSNIDPVVDDNKNYFEELVGDGRKFKTPEELARGKFESDAFIERMKRENEGLRQDLATRQRLEEIADRISTPKEPVPTRTEATPQASDTNGAKGLTPDELEAYIDKRLKEKEKQSRQDDNYAEVQRRLSEVWGPNYVTNLKAQARELDIDEGTLNGLALTQPKAFFKLLGLDTAHSAQPTPAPSVFGAPRSSVNTTPQSFRPTGDRTNSFYEDMRKRDSSTYWTPKIQNQMHQDAMRQGEKFFDA